MARTYNKAGKTKAAPVKTAAEKTATEKTAEKAVPSAEKKTGAPAKESPAKTVIAAPDKKVMEQVVYQPSSQILTREVDPSETFAIGDDMPIYYL